MLLNLKNIVKRYDVSPGKDPLTVLDGISFQVNHGETIAVVGPSGSGKSTLLNIVGALDKPTSGVVLFEGNNLAEMKDNDVAHFRNEKIGFIFQLHHLLPQCTVLENVLIPTLTRKTHKHNEELRNRAEELLIKVGLNDHLDYFPARLSGGEQQRVAVVRALINKPKLLLADEPTGSLDQTSAENLGRLLLQINKEDNVSLIVVTHSLDLARKMDTVYSLSNGKLEPFNTNY
ncbi:MAG: ABC transporter ATP-binding protein [Candidatus Latescibacteria bacterium]|nr:ABC transporter ATP-binding protein [Candidatus Latescibacterota bacterium]